MGPLQGIKIIEMGGLGPAPFAGMMLADMGADVILVERPNSLYQFKIPDGTRRGKRSIILDLKKEEDKNTLLELIEKADVLFEGFRPGVMERLGLSPEICMERNPKLIFGRMTGWGQEGPLSHVAGHDINYISLSGVLHAIGRPHEKPVVPINLVGDYGGGAMFLVTGILATLIETQKSGKGQVIDVAMTDGSAVLMSVFHTLHSLGRWTTQRGTNFIDSGSHYYDAYKTQDNKYISIGSLEPQFYQLLIEKLELDIEVFQDQNNPEKWKELKSILTQKFKTKTQKEWCDLLEGTDVCFAPVLSYEEAPHHPHNKARNTYIEVDGILQPAPAPRFSRTKSEVKHGSHTAGEDKENILKDWGINHKENQT